MIEKVRKILLKYQVAQETDEICVALSGGADSVCLTYILNDLKDEFGFKLSAFHFR